MEYGGLSTSPQFLLEILSDQSPVAMVRFFLAAEQTAPRQGIRVPVEVVLSRVRIWGQVTLTRKPLKTNWCRDPKSLSQNPVPFRIGANIESVPGFTR